MEERKLLVLYGLKYNPFSPGIPVEDLFRPKEVDRFIYRVENLVMDGGFAIVSGDNGTGKSKVLQILAHDMDAIGDVVVGVMERPQSKLGDWYRELGDLFGVELTPTNRYGGFKSLRNRFRNHIKSTLFRPVLLIDEAQLVPTESLTELRLLSSAHFDSQVLLTTVLCGDSLLPERFRERELTALGSRIRTRLHLGPRSLDELRSFLEHLLQSSGAPALMTEGVKETVIAHCGGNFRILMGICAELLVMAANENKRQIDEQLYFDFSGQNFSNPPRNSQAKKAQKT